eukprot:gene1183-12939_t
MGTGEMADLPHEQLAEPPTKPVPPFNSPPVPPFVSPVPPFNSPVVTGPPDAHIPGNEFHRDMLNEVRGTSSALPAIVVILSMLCCSACIVVAIHQAEAGDNIDDYQTGHWWNRNDKFHPRRVALEGRWFAQYGPVVYENQTWHPPIHSPFNDNDCLCHSSKYRTANPQLCATARARAMTMNLPGPYPECTFKVPYTAIWSAMAASFFGFAACAIYARSVMLKRRGTHAMDQLATTIAESSMVFLQSEYKYMAPVALALWVFIFVAVDGQSNGYRPDASVSFLVGALLSTGCGYVGMNIA